MISCLLANKIFCNQILSWTFLIQLSETVKYFNISFVTFFASSGGAKLFSKCLKESCFPDYWKVLSMVSVFKNVWERSTAKNFHPVSLLSVVGKVFEKLVIIKIVDHLEISGLFSDVQYGFRSSLSTTDLLKIVSDRIARAFNRSGATRAVALDISTAFDRDWHAGILHKLRYYGISG